MMFFCGSITSAGVNPSSRAVDGMICITPCRCASSVPNRLSWRAWASRRRRGRCSRKCRLKLQSCRRLVLAQGQREALLFIDGATCLLVEQCLTRNCKSAKRGIQSFELGNGLCREYLAGISHDPRLQFVNGHELGIHDLELPGNGPEYNAMKAARSNMTSAFPSRISRRSWK
jgi:hypothetical protein